MLDTATIGACCGGALVACEVVSCALVACCRETMQRKFPRIARHCGVCAKATSYRMFAGADTFLISFLVTGHVATATAVVGFELISKFCLYYGHEWQIGRAHV